LTNPTPARVGNLVNSRIKEVMEEGELDESDLTFRDLKKDCRNIYQDTNRHISSPDRLQTIFQIKSDEKFWQPINKQ